MDARRRSAQLVALKLGKRTETAGHPRPAKAIDAVAASPPSFGSNRRAVPAG
jgi:hypothetical protein